MAGTKKVKDIIGKEALKKKMKIKDFEIELTLYAGLWMSAEKSRL